VRHIAAGPVPTQEPSLADQFQDLGAGI
jgi:hypothetical protein